MTKMLIAGTQKLVRHGLKSILEAQFGKSAELDQSSFDAAIPICRKFKPDIVLLDVDYSNGRGLEIAARLIRSPTQPKLIFITGKNQASILHHILEVPASAYLTKNCAGNELIEAVKSVIKGDLYVSDEFSRLVTLERMRRSVSMLSSALSRREIEVLILLAEGGTPNEIGNCLRISPKTVSTYKQRIHHKLNTRNTADITRFAIQSGLLDKI